VLHLTGNKALEPEDLSKAPKQKLWNLWMYKPHCSLKVFSFFESNLPVLRRSLQILGRPSVVLMVNFGAPR